MLWQGIYGGLAAACFVQHIFRAGPPPSYQDFCMVFGACVLWPVTATIGGVSAIQDYRWRKARRGHNNG